MFKLILEIAVKRLLPVLIMCYMSWQYWVIKILCIHKSIESTDRAIQSRGEHLFSFLSHYYCTDLLKSIVLCNGLHRSVSHGSDAGASASAHSAHRMRQTDCN